jgi:hypothetical protein
MRPGKPPDHHDNRPRVLLLLALAVGAVALIGTLFTRGGDGGSSQQQAGGCRVPAGAHAGTETPPALVARLVEPLPAPDVRFTQQKSGSTVYDYCYDIVDGEHLIQVVHTLEAAGYSPSTERNPIGQVLYRAEGKTPYGVSLTVTGSLDVSNPAADQTGGLSIVWIDSKPR